MRGCHDSLRRAPETGAGLTGSEGRGRGRLEGIQMLGQGEGLELLGVFITVLGSLAVLAVLGKWWEA